MKYLWIVDLRTKKDIYRGPDAPEQRRLAFATGRYAMHIFERDPTGVLIHDEIFKDGTKESHDLRHVNQGELELMIEAFNACGPSSRA